MSSSLTWIDHDPAARERSLRILALFQEKESRDELGLGGIRDSFADLLFPGTSTIQTRLRYMLFVPWIYRALEEERVPPAEFARRADREERDLIVAMRNVDEREDGVFGGRSGRHLKRLPSAVYWAGLASWKIRLTDQSQDEYRRGIGRVYQRREAHGGQRAERGRTGDDGNHSPDSASLTWHARLPPPPAEFPTSADFQLTQEEALFLRDRLKQCHPRSLFAHLAVSCKLAEVDAPWEHPDFGSFTQEHRELLEHARRFSEVMHGAALVYNLALAKTREWEAKIVEHRERLVAWLGDLDFEEIGHWSLDRLWDLTLEQGHVITPQTRHFVQTWVGSVLALQKGLVENKPVSELVRQRETSLKKAHSRFTNRQALQKWGGSSGLVPMTYRWRTAGTFLRDLDSGLRQGSR